MAGSGVIIKLNSAQLELELGLSLVINSAQLELELGLSLAKLDFTTAFPRLLSRNQTFRKILQYCETNTFCFAFPLVKYLFI